MLWYHQLLHRHTWYSIPKAVNNRLHHRLSDVIASFEMLKRHYWNVHCDRAGLTAVTVEYLLKYRLHWFFLMQDSFAQYPDLLHQVFALLGIRTTSNRNSWERVNANIDIVIYIFKQNSSDEGTKSVVLIFQSLTLTNQVLTMFPEGVCW